MLDRSAADDALERGHKLIEAAARLAPAIKSAADRVERERRIPADILDAMHEARLFRMLIPRSIGGEEVAPATLFQVVEMIGSADASVAWCLGQNSGVSMGAAYVAPEVAQALWSHERAAVATGAPSPAAKAIVTDGGYRVTGHWQFASGSRHAQWIGGHATVCEADGTPRLGPGGRALEQRTMFFPKDSATITDTWQVMGLRGTGSDDYAVNDLFVPQAYSFTREADADRRETGPLYRFSIFNMFGLAFCAVALGIARTTLEDFIALAKAKKAHSSGLRLAENNLVQTQVGVSHAKLAASRAHVLTCYNDLYEQALAGEKVSPTQRLSSRSATCLAIQHAREVVDFAFHASGAGAIFERNPFERRFRDMNTVSQQSQAHIENFEAYGQSLLGIEPKRKL